MGAIQGSINQMLGTSAIAIGAVSHEMKETEKAKTELESSEIGLKKIQASESAQQLKVNEAQHTMDNVSYTKKGRARYKDTGKFISHYDLGQMQQALKAAQDEQTALVAQRQSISKHITGLRERLGIK